MKKKLSKKWIVIILLVTILISAWLHRLSFSSYFFQDDWFSFRISVAKNPKDILLFFVPRKDVIYYRPLGMQVPFFVVNNIFGLNSFAFRMVVLATHAVNIVLVFILTYLLLKRKKIALLTAFLYGTSTVHFLIFYWFAIYAFIAGPTFFFLSFILYILYLDNKNVKYYLFSFLTFIGGLMTNEIIVVLPIVLFTYGIFLHKCLSKKKLIPYFFSVFIILIIRFIFFTPPSTGVYHLSIGRHILSNLKTYFFWSFNWSEILTEQMAKIFIFNDKITSLYSYYALLTLITFVVICLLFYIFPLIVIISTRKLKLFLSVIFFGVSWFVSGLLPVLLFSDHKFSYYLPISLVGLLIVSLCLFSYLVKVIHQSSKLLAHILLGVLVITWLWVTYSTIDLNTKIHWAPRRAFLARTLINNVKEQTTKQQSLVDRIYIPYSSENKFALNDQDGLKVVLGREDIVTIYTKEK